MIFFINIGIRRLSDFLISNVIIRGTCCPASIKCYLSLLVARVRVLVDVVRLRAHVVLLCL